MPFLACEAAGAAGNSPEQNRPALEDLLKQLGFRVVPLKGGRGSQLFLDAQVCGKPRRFLIDTGCPITTLDKSAAKNLKSLRDLGATLDDPVLGRADDPSLVLMDELRLGSARLVNQPARVRSLAPLEYGILGCDFFLRHNCLIDGANGRLFLRGTALKVEAQAMLERSLTRSGYHETGMVIGDTLLPTCDARINSVPVRLLVATGSLFTLLDDGPATRCGLRWQETGRQMRDLVVPGRIIKTLGAQPQSFTIDGLAVPHGLILNWAEMSEWPIGEKKPALKSVDGVIGADLLAVGRVLIDFPRRKLWLRPAPASGSPTKPVSYAN
jgi:predicted aspartyl protease